jgi:hypothetical protein
LALRYPLQRRWKEIAFVIAAKLFAGFRKRRAGYAPCEERYALIFGSVPSSNVSLDDVPTRAIFTEGLTGIVVALNED